MKSDDKLKAMFFIWGAFVMASLFTFSSRTLETGHVFIALFFVVAALAATHTVMEAPLPEEQQPTKSKSRKVDRMLSNLNEEEMEQLRQRLSDDGELISLDEVMRRKDG